MEWIPYIFWFFAAFFNAVMDSLENLPNFNKTIFKNLPKEFWLKEVSWQFAPKILGWKGDAWHISKSLWIICIIGTIISSTILEPMFRPWVNVIVLGLQWNGVFGLFYTHIFRIK